MSRPRRYEFDSDASFYLSCLVWLDKKFHAATGMDRVVLRAAKWRELAVEAQRDRIIQLVSMPGPLDEDEERELERLIEAHHHRRRITRTTDRKKENHGDQ